jgi:flavin reductase (DIM6/NTAB) family NADH-FMN oxidoreductase RutF
MSFDVRGFRDAMGRFATGVTLVTAVGPDGAPIGLTANSFTSLSLDPPLVLWSLDRKSDTLPIFTECRHFGVNVLQAHHRELSTKFATKQNHHFDAIPFETWDSGVPIIPDALAAMECEVHARHDGGDHVIMVGRVLGLRSHEDGVPLMFYRGKYADLAHPVPAGAAQPEGQPKV